MSAPRGRGVEPHVDDEKNSVLERKTRIRHGSTESAKTTLEERPKLAQVTNTVPPTAASRPTP